MKLQTSLILLALLVILIMIVVLIIVIIQPSKSSNPLKSRMSKNTCDLSTQCKGNAPYCVDNKCSFKKGVLNQMCVHDDDCEKNLSCILSKCVDSEPPNSGFIKESQKIKINNEMNRMDGIDKISKMSETGETNDRNSVIRTHNVNNIGSLIGNQTTSSLIYPTKIHSKLNPHPDPNKITPIKKINLIGNEIKSKNYNMSVKQIKDRRNLKYR